MATSAWIGLLFLSIAAVFLALAFREYVRGERRVARSARLRVGIIFTIVGLGLQLVHRAFGP